MRTILTESISTVTTPRSKKPGLSFVPRQDPPIKGTHLAIEVARSRDIPLKIAGEVQPIFQDYFDSEIKPHIDGKFMNTGEADLQAKNEIAGNHWHGCFPISGMSRRPGDD